MISKKAPGCETAHKRTFYVLTAGGILHSLQCHPGYDRPRENQTKRTGNSPTTLPDPLGSCGKSNCRASRKPTVHASTGINPYRKEQSQTIDQTTHKSTSTQACIFSHPSRPLS
ncbi:unnamed protein product, partial [Ectocarpus fasciculatus]